MIFSTVSTFVEQVGRRYTWRYAELDNMVSFWIGPSIGALSFKPQVNAPHPEYPLMFCTDSEITRKEGLVAEVQATYQGIIQTNGASSYITPPITTETPVQGSRDFQQAFMALKTPAAYSTGPTGQPITGFVIGATYDYGTQSIAVRYVGVQCNVRYQSYPRPTRLHYSSLGKSRVTWTILSRTLGPRTVAATGVSQPIAQAAIDQMEIPKIPPLYAANLGVNITQKGKWYEVVEVYGPTF